QFEAEQKIAVPTEEAKGAIPAMAKVHRRRPRSERVLNLFMNGDVLVPFAVLLIRRSGRVDNVSLQQYAGPNEILALCGSKKFGIFSDSHGYSPMKWAVTD